MLLLIQIIFKQFVLTHTIFVRILLLTSHCASWCCCCCSRGRSSSCRQGCCSLHTWPYKSWYLVQNYAPRSDPHCGISRLQFRKWFLRQ